MMSRMYKRPQGHSRPQISSYKTTILIVGAPAGLAAARSLLHHGFHDLIIVDAIPQGENMSRAIVVHPATLEALDTSGCGDDFIAQGPDQRNYLLR
ncbi:hypothetical protein EV363DRAFT_1589541 [Boletus edulis]|nr:hypothetical protein EV363DRAFT_1589541 [Boletus edulis]